MSTWLTAIVTLIYVAIAVDLTVRRDWLGLTFAGYDLANVGIIMSLSRGAG